MCSLYYIKIITEKICRKVTGQGRSPALAVCAIKVCVHCTAMSLRMIVERLDSIIRTNFTGQPVFLQHSPIAISLSVHITISFGKVYEDRRGAVFCTFLECVSQQRSYLWCLVQAYTECVG